MRTAAKLNAVTKKFLEVESELPGWICLDPQIETSIRNQRPLTLYGQCQGLEDRRSMCEAASRAAQGSCPERSVAAYGAAGVEHET
jgi:hypothetical protein